MASFFAVRTALPLLGAIACAVLAGCSSSSTPGTADAGHTTHDATDAKQREDARRDATKVDAGFDAGIDSAIVDAAPNCPYDGPPFTVEAGLAFTLEAGSTWQSLYRDYFGNLATAGCAGDGNCHGGTDQFGFQASGFLCPAGDASATCYRGLTSPIDGGVVFILPDASFRNDFLSQNPLHDRRRGRDARGVVRAAVPLRRVQLRVHAYRHAAHRQLGVSERVRSRKSERAG